ncbi:hypothetical protein CYMTET_18285 [Cymbomonas tetramitiformis]|uniref:Dynein regulatory complex subunit 7 n=1 Tax=Cymbomonas tetramitiformis TaxID=36881 RepID=A0AAE0G8U6_9CHLO|nr:hypothetical protein CYMTET_18285 [Cymbomonas tetramitiformis]
MEGDKWKAKLSDCKKTGKLNLSYAELTEISPALIHQIKNSAPNITELDLRSNQLTSLPEELTELRTLRSVKLNYNKFTTFPPVLTNLPRLTSLEMSGNQLQALDDVFGKLSVIKEIDFSGNQLAQLNPCISKLNTLNSINLENNLLTSLPEEIGHMRNLSRLDMSTNRLYHLPNSLGKLAPLSRIDVSANNLSMVPPSMGHLKGLREFDLRYNDLKEPAKSKYEEGLHKFLEFLREEEERLRQEEIERLKPVGTEVGSWLEYRIKVGQQDGIDCRCYLRSGHSLTVGGNKVYIFGGTLTHQGTKSNELFIMNQDRMEWSKVEQHGSIPPARDGHCAAYDAARKQLIVFGGRNQEKKRLNDMHVLDTKTMTWRRPNMDGTVPSAREYGTFLPMSGNTLCLFGGHGAGQRFNDLHYLDLESFMWMQPTIAGSAPSPRQGAAMAVLGDLLFVHGGRNNFVLDDLFCMNSSTMTWMEVQTQGRTPPARHGHVLTCVGNSLYIYGGQDELSGVSNNLYRLSGLDLLQTQKDGKVSTPAVGPSGQPIRPEWSEINPEMLTNVCRVACFSGDYLCSFQVGSASLGLVVGSEVTDETFWDCFKTTLVTDLQEKELDEASLKPQNAKKMRIKHTCENIGAVPRASFRGVSAKEALMLEYVENFRLQFVELYPKRRPLFLFPPNECKVNKFVCTTIRPTQLPFTELYDFDTCIRFVADFLKYEILEDPIHYPEHLPAPYSIFLWQAGDCFDLSVALVSLLTGVGYDAYCVVGYAPKPVTMNNQSKDAVPFMEKPAKEEVKVDKVERSDKPVKYSIRQALVLESQFINEQDAKLAEQEAAQAAEAPPAAAEEDEEDVLDEDDGPDELAGKRVHAWVLVVAGKREVAENFFVEPSTGRTYTCNGSPYEGIEFIWNHTNFWVNMQEGTINHLGAKQMEGISWDLKNPDKWEFVLETQDPLEGLRVGHSDSNDAGDGEGTEGAPPAPAETTEDAGADGEAGTQKTEQLLDMPPSWVPKLIIPREVFDMRCPKGVKITTYERSTYEVFAMFGECARWDGMVSRLTLFSDKARSVVSECREVYARRKDKLRERWIFPLDDTVTEYFDPGSSFGLKEMTTVKSKRRLMHFYESARLDGLVTREEEFGLKTVEHFNSRDDRLVYRSVTYEPLQAKPATPPPAVAPTGKAKRPKKKNEEPLQPIRKMTEKYTVDKTQKPDKSVAKRTFYVSGDQIRLDFHYGKDKITASSRHYTKEGLSHITQVDPLEEKPRDAVLLEEWQKLVIAEKECTQAVRDVERETKDLILSRGKEEQNISLVTPYYDVVRVKQEESDDESNDVEEKVEHDYLSPFMPPVIGGRKLSRQEAMDVREKCLKALKDRLIERANIIQARHDEETAALAKRQANFQRDRDQMTRAEEEEYERAREESIFRIHILEQRLKRHEEQALQKYYDLDSKLRNDPRLGVLMTG